MTAYQDFDMLKRTIFALPGFSFYIHLDSKSNLVDKKSELLSLNNVCFVSSDYSISWGSFNHIQAILLLLEKAISDDMAYIHIISGQDYPVLSEEEIFDFSKTENIYMSCFSVNNPRVDFTRQRIAYPRRFAELDLKNPIVKNLEGLSKKTREFLKIKRNAIGPFDFEKIFTGMVWSSFPRAFGEYVLEQVRSDEKLINDLKVTKIPEEFIFQTLAMNSKFKKDVVANHLRYMDWSNKGLGPATLVLDDLEKITASKFLFARKWIL